MKTEKNIQTCVCFEMHFLGHFIKYKKFIAEEYLTIACLLQIFEVPIKLFRRKKLEYMSCIIPIINLCNAVPQANLVKLE